MLTEKEVLRAVIRRFMRGGRSQGGPLITHSATEPACLHASVRYATGWRYEGGTMPQVMLGRRTMRHIEKTMRTFRIKGSAIEWNDRTKSTAAVLKVLRAARDTQFSKEAKP